MLIPLSAFDAPRVLAGARLCLYEEEGEGTRWEWCGDTMIEMSATTGNDYLWSDRKPHSATSNAFHGLALDPTDLDITRLIDRRIAEALPNFRPWTGPQTPWYSVNWGQDYRARRADRRHWSVGGARADWGPDGKSRVRGVPDMPCLAGLEIGDETLPEARRRLLIALYPPVVS